MRLCSVRVPRVRRSCDAVARARPASGLGARAVSMVQNGYKSDKTRCNLTGSVISRERLRVVRVNATQWHAAYNFSRTAQSCASERHSGTPPTRVVRVNHSGTPRALVTSYDAPVPVDKLFFVPLRLLDQTSRWLPLPPPSSAAGVDRAPGVRHAYGAVTIRQVKSGHWYSSSTRVYATIGDRCARRPTGTARSEIGRRPRSADARVDHGGAPR